MLSLHASRRIAIALLVGALRSLVNAEPPADPPGTPAVSPAIAQAISELEERLLDALDRRDRPTLEQLVSDPFTWVHASDGRVDSREGWLTAAAQGAALSGQRLPRTESGTTLAAHGQPEPHTVVRGSRVQLLDPAASREIWLRQTHVLVRDQAGAWRLAFGQGTVMYDGTPLNAALHARYAGTYVIDERRTLTLTWDDGALLATFPNGATTQIFLASPTEEAVRVPRAGRLRFTLDADGRPMAATLTRGPQEVWRATRAPAP